MTDDRFAESVPSYVLGALPEAEVADFEAHLATCARCRTEVEGLRPVADALAASAPPAAAPVGLRDRIMTTVNAEAALLHAAGPEADAAPPARRRGWLGSLRLRPALAAVGVAALAAAAVIGFVVGQGGGGPSVTTTPAPVTAQVGSGAKAFLAHDSGRIRLEARHWANPGKGRVYQVWLKSRGVSAPTPTPALFTVGKDGSAAVDLPQAAASAQKVLVTSEQSGGSRTGIPSGPPVLTATL
jgi:anti-sigma-K factor RskA